MFVLVLVSTVKQQPMTNDQSSRLVVVTFWPDLPWQNLCQGGRRLEGGCIASRRSVLAVAIAGDDDNTTDADTPKLHWIVCLVHKGTLGMLAGWWWLR